ncbi:hypothetical protein EDB89DRAFT_2228008 [Lactarius sanguifluus]|nr:hypothetical protein EDB89DRAFT_2228008 [Lactarius sanguifluus]
MLGHERMTFDVGRVLVRCCCLKVGGCMSDSLVWSKLARTPESAAGLLRRKAPLECLVDIVSKTGQLYVLRLSLRFTYWRTSHLHAETTTAARGHPPAVSQATQYAKLNAISVASYDRTIFDFDSLFKTDVVITLRAHPNIP